MAGKTKTYKRGSWGVNDSVTVVVCEEQDGVDGKVVDLFHWASKDRRTAYEVPIRLVKETGRREDGFQDIPPIRSTHFGVWIEKPVRFGYVCTDIEILRKAIFTALDKECAIDWKEMILVKVAKSYGATYEGGAGIEFSYEAIYVGKTVDGVDLWRKRGYRDETIYEGTPKVGLVKGRRDDEEELGTMIAVVESTKENGAALEEFSARFEMLRKSLCDFISPEKVQETLDRINNMTMLLEAPKPKGG